MGQYPPFLEPGETIDMDLISFAQSHMAEPYVVVFAERMAVAAGAIIRGKIIRPDDDKLYWFHMIDGPASEALTRMLEEAGGTAEDGILWHPPTSRRPKRGRSRRSRQDRG